MGLTTEPTCCHSCYGKTRLHLAHKRYHAASRHQGTNAATQGMLCLVWLTVRRASGVHGLCGVVMLVCPRWAGTHHLIMLSNRLLIAVLMAGARAAFSA